eukprot:6212570-Pleurochrysis_carterae.AAC.5
MVRYKYPSVYRYGGRSICVASLGDADSAQLAHTASTARFSGVFPQQGWVTGLPRAQVVVKYRAVRALHCSVGPFH